MLNRSLMARCIAIVIPWMIASSTALAYLPVVERLEPLGVQRGKETTLVFHGERLKDASQVLTDLPGIEVHSVKPINNKSVEVKLTTDPQLAPGLYPVRLVTKTGIANLRLLGVGTMPVVAEVEPNNEFESPQPISLNSTMEGVIDREDVDHFQVELKAGQRLTVEIEGVRLAHSLRNRNILDPYVAILDADRFEVAASDDSSLLKQDGLCTYTATKDGRYTVLARDSAFGGSGECGYRLHVGSFPRPLAVIPPGGTAGSVMQAQLIDVDGTVSTVSIPLPSEAQDRFPAVTENDRGITPSPNWVRVNELPVAMETEPNDDRTKAPQHAVPAAFCGVIEKENDFDCFSFDCKKGEKYRVQVYAREVLRSPLDAVLNVFGPDNKTLSSSDDSRGELDPFIEFTAPADGKHTVRIYDHLRSGSPVHAYRIELTRPEPGFDLVLNEMRRDEAMTVDVPIGGSAAMVVRATRDGYNEAITLELGGLPQGVTATTFPIPPGRIEIPVLLTASSEATPQATLFDLVGRGDEKHSDVTGELKQKHNLVLGQNRREMWAYETDRAAMGVTDAAPFSIEMVQPQTPIVRDGSKELTVRIKRDEGFEGSVSLRALYNPPGMGINNSRKIDKGQNEATIPITANGGAATGTWPLIMIASYGTDNGTAQIATPPIMLQVESQLFSYEFPKAAAEQGAETTIAVKLDVLREYTGDAEVELVGLPNGVTSSAAVQSITPESTSVAFPVSIAADAKPGNHKTLNCISRVKVGDEVIVQTVGTGELRVDKPLPTETEKPAEEAKPEPEKETKPAPEKVLSRLEKLRQQKMRARGTE